MRVWRVLIPVVLACAIVDVQQPPARREVAQTITEGTSLAACRSTTVTLG